MFSSGMGAITTTLLALSKPGDRILTHLDTFARSYHFIRDFMGKWGIQADISNPGTENIIDNSDFESTKYRIMDYIKLKITD